jgi:hypothetical protein
MPKHTGTTVRQAHASRYGPLKLSCRGAAEARGSDGISNEGLPRNSSICHVRHCGLPLVQVSEHALDENRRRNGGDQTMELGC